MRYRFDEFVFDPERGLARHGEPVALEPLASELLRFLIENRGRIVSRDEVHERLWDGRIVSDAALSTQIRSVRRALGDDREHQRFVKTHPRRGFSFVAAVERLDGEGEGPEDATARPVSARPRTRAPRPRAMTTVAAGVALLLAAAALAVWRGGTTAEAPAPPALSIAVLPFDALSGDRARDYLADAFTEELITDLSRIRDAFVISRSTTFTYRGRAVEAGTVAAELGVRYVLEGSIRITGDKVRVNAQLIDGRTDSHIWSERYESTLAALFDLRENVTGRIAAALRAELRVADSRRQGPAPAAAAWDYALRGNVILYNHQSIADYQQAYALLTKAAALDPTISSAWTGLAFVHYVASVAEVPGLSGPDSAVRSLAAAQKAAEADPMNAEPYWLLGVGYARTGRPERGESACRTAIELNPNMDCGYVCAALVHMSEGEPVKAVPELRHALRLNPLFRPFTKEKYLGLAYIQSGKDALAIAALNRALAKAPRDGFANLALAAALALGGRAAEARDTLARHLAAVDEAPTIAALRRSIGWMGPGTERMLEALRDLGLPEG